MKLKEKLGLCIYEEIFDEKEFISMSEKSFIQHDVENKQEKVENKQEKIENKQEKVVKVEKAEMSNKNKQFKKNNILKEEPKEIKSSNWIDKNKIKEILAIIDSNKFSHRNKIGELKYDNIKDLVNDIKNNTISEIYAKKDLNALEEIKNVEITKYIKRTPKHKELLNLFNFN